MLVNAGNLSSRQPDDETQNKKRGANPWENLQLTENNSLQGMSVQNLKQLTLLDMGITLNSNKKALNDAIGKSCDENIPAHEKMAETVSHRSTQQEALASSVTRE